MKIAYILPSINNVGPIVNCRDIVNFVSDFHTTQVFYFLRDRDTLIFNCLKQKVSFLKKLELNEFEIVHTCGFFPDLYVCLYSLIYKKKFIWVSSTQNYVGEDLYYEYPNFLKRNILLFTWKICLKRADKIITLTKHMKNYYRMLLNKKEDSFEVINNGRSFYQAENLSLPEEDTSWISKIKYNNKKTLFISCLLTKRKGVEQAIKALSQLKDFTLLVIGDGPEKENLILESIKQGVVDRCFFLGYRTNAYRYLAFADVVLFLSRSEGFPLALIEAMYYGSAIVCSNLPQIQEEVFDEIVYYQLDDINGLANAISTALEIKDILKIKSKIKYNNNFTSQVMGQRHLVFYERIK